MPSPPPYKIITYGSLEPDTTPEDSLFGAALFIGYETVPRWTASGPTADAAREKMAAFWDKERKAHEPREAPKKGKPAPATEPVSEDDGEVL